MGESAYLTYYQKNRDVILNRAKDYMKMIKKDQEGKQEINAEAYLKKKIKRENMEKTDIVIKPEEKKQRLKEY